jgi:hypothetical protein
MTAAVIVAREENDFDEDVYYGRKTYEPKNDLDNVADLDNQSGNQSGSESGSESGEGEQSGDAAPETEVLQGTACKI